MRRLALIVIALTAFAAAADALAQSEGSLRGGIGASRARERSLAGAAARLGALERATERDVSLFESRVNDVQSELAAAEARAQQTQLRLDAERRRVVRLEK